MPNRKSSEANAISWKPRRACCRRAGSVPGICLSAASLMQLLPVVPYGVNDRTPGSREALAKAFNSGGMSTMGASMALVVRLNQMHPS
jgi:hypothetical protein